MLYRTLKKCFIAIALATNWVSAAPTNLLLEELSRIAGQHVIYSFEGLTPPDQLFDLVKDGKVGGIILFKANVGNQTAAIIEKLQTEYKQSPYYLGVPLIITTDQEGGEVRRVPGGPDLSEKQVGESTDPAAAATEAGKEAQEALSAYNVNANLAPVVDIFRETGNFIDEFQRSYGNNSKIVSECAAAFISQQQELGIISTAKHFPGLGAAPLGSNTDLAPVTLNLSLSEIREVDEVPYTAAIAAGVKMVMTSWAIYPSLDAKMPSGLSKAWVQEELRGRLHFRGVTITDALEAGALDAFGDIGNRAVLASQAGMDIVLASQQNVTEGEAATTAIAAALADGSLSIEVFAEATERIISLRRGLIRRV